jgi:hypothetical protein
MNDRVPAFRLSAVRDLLLAGYANPSDLPRFLLYTENPELKEARKEFGPNDGVAAMVDKLIAYCDTHGLLPALVTAIERDNEAQYARFAARLRVAPTPDRPRAISLDVTVADIVEYPTDVLALKFAGGLYGADQAVAYALDTDANALGKKIPSTWQSVLLPPNEQVAAKQILFVNVGDLFRFDYEGIREFARRVLNTLARSTPATRHLAMTIHGVGYGLDETEALQSQLAGYLDAIDERQYPPGLEQITLVERNPLRAERLRTIVETTIPGSSVELSPPSDDTQRSSTIEAAAFMSNVGRASAQKRLVFVAWPDTDEMDDTYYFGVYLPVKDTEKYLCERGEITGPTVDLERIKAKIETASLVIAELTGSNPNVFLQLGYAWGKGRRTLLLVRDVDKLSPTLRTERCLVYKNIRNLAEALAEALREMT